MSNRNTVTLEQKNNKVPEVETQHSSPPTSAKPNVMPSFFIPHYF